MRSLSSYVLGMEQRFDLGRARPRREKSRLTLRDAVRLRNSFVLPVDRFPVDSKPKFPSDTKKGPTERVFTRSA